MPAIVSAWTHIVMNQNKPRLVTGGDWWAQGTQHTTHACSWNACAPQQPCQLPPFLARVQVRELSNPRRVYTELMEMLARLAGLGLVHCDYNEFNLLVRHSVLCSG